MKHNLAHALSVRLFLPFLALLWGPGCGIIEDEPERGEAPLELPLAQGEQGLTLTYTLSWADNRFTGGCNWEIQPPINGYASGRLEEPLTITGMAGRRIRSLNLSSTYNTAFKYDDVW